MTMNYYSIERSMQTAKERGEAIKISINLIMRVASILRKVLKLTLFLSMKKVKALFEGLEIPTAEDWKALEEDVKEYGLYHAYRFSNGAYTKYFLCAECNKFSNADCRSN